jgi:hypothetical protein
MCTSPYSVQLVQKLAEEAVAVGVLVVIVLAIGPLVRGFVPGRKRLIFKGDKNL